MLLRPPYAGDERLDLLTKLAPGESRGRDPLGQKPSQNGLAGVKICGLRRSIFIGRNTASLAGDTRTGVHGYPTKGAHRGDADTMDHTAAPSPGFRTEGQDAH